MLSLHPLDDEQAITTFNNWSLSPLDGQTIALNVDGRDVGVLTFTISSDLSAHIRGVFVLPDFRGKGLGDFLTRSMMNSFTLSNMGVIVDYTDENDYYSKFGFKQTERGLYVSPEDIVFPSKCGHH